MKPVVEAKQMQQAEEAAFLAGLSPKEAMARAGQAVFEAAKGFSRVLVYARCGNNGGDGFVCAHLLHKAGISVDVLVLGSPEKLSPHAAFYYEAIQPLVAERPQGEYDCVIDALFGIGFHGELTGPEKEAAEKINEYGKKATVLAVDVPSGLCCTNGRAATCVKADITVTFGCKKAGQILGRGADVCGQVRVADIGIYPLEACALEAEIEDIAALLPPVQNTAHKGTNGHVGVLAGSPGMEGAGELAAVSALRCGAGKVSLMVPKECAAYYNGRHPEIMVQVADFTEEAVISFLKDKNAVLFGPGVGRKEAAAQVLKTVLKFCTVPLVIDADGLYFCTAELLQSARCPVLVTPHMGEAARLFGQDMPSLLENPLACAGEFAQNTGTVVLLKSNYNLVCSTKERVFSAWGCPAMATAGSGDVLAGIAAGASLLCGNLRDAALLASYLHGTAGRAAQRKKGVYSTLASDISENIFEAFLALSAFQNAEE